MSKIKIKYCEFYITHVCNLACSGCNRFNNFKFAGFQRWQDYKDVYRQWSEIVDPDSIAILGGEPLLNPTFMEWAQGIAELWPTKLVRVITNGFQLDRVKGLYELIDSNRNIVLWVGIHNKQHKIKIIDQVKNLTQAPHTLEFNTDNPYQQYLILTDSNGVQVRIEYNWWFHQGALIATDTGQYTLHNSDPVKAHDICNMRECHHFVNGLLYKCGFVATIEDFDKQHNLQLSPQDRELMLSYRPLSITDTPEEKKNFIAKLPDVIDQCKFCPEVYNGAQIFAQEKKIMFK
jgi:hypothetical protein